MKVQIERAHCGPENKKSEWRTRHILAKLLNIKGKGKKKFFCLLAKRRGDIKRLRNNGQHIAMIISDLKIMVQSIISY